MIFRNGSVCAFSDEHSLSVSRDLPTGEKATSAKFGRRLDKAKLGKPDGKRIFRLHGGHMMNGICPAKQGRRNLGIVEAEGFAFIDQLDERFGQLFDRNQMVATVYIDQIDIVDTSLAGEQFSSVLRC